MCTGIDWKQLEAERGRSWPKDENRRIWSVAAAAVVDVIDVIDTANVVGNVYVHFAFIK